MFLELDSRDHVTSLMADTLKCNCKLNGAAYLAKPHTNIHAGAGGRSQGASLPSPHTCLGYLLIRSLSRRIHASMAQLLPMARAWLPCHQRGLRDRNQKQFRKEARRFSKCKRLLCCAGAGHQGRAACGSLHLPPGGTLLPGAQILPHAILRAPALPLHSSTGSGVSLGLPF